MIDEKQLIEELQALATSREIIEYTSAYDTVQDCIGIVEKQPKADWIPCDKELPPMPKENPLYENKPLQVYLVSVKNCEEPFRAFWNSKCFTDGWSKLNVDAWMELPQPYKKEGAE